MHLCFGYAEMVPDKPAAYSFLSELADSTAEQISIETAQPNLDLGVLADLSNKQSCSAYSTCPLRPDTAEQVAGRIRKGLKYVAPSGSSPRPIAA